MAWDDCLAALCATEPKLKLNDIDVMIGVDCLRPLLVVAQNSRNFLSKKPMRGIAFNMSLIDKTLVIKIRPQYDISGAILVPSTGIADTKYYMAATESMPEVEDSTIHHQLLRYKLGPLSCLVRSKVNGTLQDMPASTGSSERPRACDLHAIDVIKAGQGVLITESFTGTTRPPPRRQADELDRLNKKAPLLLFSGLTKLGIADIVPDGRSVGGLTVVEMRELVSQFEDRNQDGLRRLVGLLTTLRAAVQAHGAPCVGVFLPRVRAQNHTDGESDFTFSVHSAGPEEAPVLLDWHKEHFWSLEKAPSKRSRPRVEPSNGHPQPQKRLIGRLAEWLGFRGR